MSERNEDLPLDDQEEEDLDDREEDENRRMEAAVRKIVDGFDQLCDVLGHEQAWRNLRGFLEQVKPPRKAKGRHRPDVDEALLAARRSAPKGKKLRQVHAVGAQYDMKPDAALRHLRRLLSEQKKVDALFREWRERRKVTGMT